MDGVVSVYHGDAPFVDRKNKVFFDFPPNKKITVVFEKQVLWVDEILRFLDVLHQNCTCNMYLECVPVEKEYFL